jgi:hypothetical protein
MVVVVVLFWAMKESGVEVVEGGGKSIGGDELRY